MSTTYFTKDHEYIRVDGNTGTVGITAYAAAQLGDIVFVELPETGKELSQGAEAAVVESVKAASEIYAPVSGQVSAVNNALEAAPQSVNESPEGEGWFFTIMLSDHSELETLMDEAGYRALIGE